jgi:hypothetical protein
MKHAPDRIFSGSSAMESSVLTFIIPIRHQANAKDWAALKANLVQTVRSIAGQSDPRWRAVIVANAGADLPPLPAGFSVVSVDFPPNALHEKGSAPLEQIYQAFRMDKGRRVLAGLIAARPQGHVMIVDDDDFVSNRLVSFVAQNAGSNGWYLSQGYVWSPDDSLVYREQDFSHICGTSHIIRADLYAIPMRIEDASTDYIQQMLGSHVKIAPALAANGNPLAPLPFAGAIYRIGHPGAHSKSWGLIGKCLLPGLKRGPAEFVRRLARLTRLSPSLRAEFFGAQDAD